MKTLTVLLQVILISLLMNSNILSKENSLFKNDLYSISFYNKDAGCICGAGGLIFITTNGGNTWKDYFSGTTRSLFSTCFTDSLTCYCVGADGCIIKTTNGGKYWTKQNSRTNQVLYSVYFINNNTGYVTGSLGTILKTTDGGINWVKQSSGITKELVSVYFVNENLGYAAGERYFLKTTDGGKNWISQSFASSYYLRFTYFKNENIGYAAGNSGLFKKTTDGGSTWSTKNTGIYGDIKSVCFVDDNTAFAAVSDGAILKTTDDCETWTRTVVENESSFRSIYFLSADTGFVFGNYGAAFKTTNGGESWGPELFKGVSSNLNPEVKWLRVSNLQAPVNNLGAEYEVEFNQNNTNLNFLSWPAKYSIEQSVTRSKALWIGCKNFADPVGDTINSYKVIGIGPANTAAPDAVFPKEIKMIGRYAHPAVNVDGQAAGILNQYDVVDEYNPNLACDRMVVTKFNTSMGVSVTKKVMAFTNQEHENYFINDYVFKNTGIYNAEGDIKQQTLLDTWFYFYYRHAFSGVSCTGYGLGWSGFSTTWGSNTLNHSFGENPGSPEYKDNFNNPMRGYYSYPGPSPDNYGSTGMTSYDEDWGTPNYNENGVLASAKYSGCITLHADTNPVNASDDFSQPKTTWYISPDIEVIGYAYPSQYDAAGMQKRYNFMSEGHPSVQHDAAVGNNYAQRWMEPDRSIGGGTAIGQGYGPYTLAPGDSIHIVFAEGVSGISWEKGREVGANWLQWKNNSGSPTLTMPDGSTTANYNEYKRSWVVDAGRDSIIKTYRNAINNYYSGYNIPKAPAPPAEFNVAGGSSSIKLTWSNNAASEPHFGGYVIYRSQGSVLDWQTIYEKIFETERADITSFEDTNTFNGIDYYYYIQTKDDGTQNDVEPSKPLYSSMFWTVTNIPAHSAKLLTAIDSKNPYLLPREYRIFQNYPNPFNPVAIIKYGLPKESKVKILVYNTLGECIKQLVNTYQDAGYHEVRFSAGGLASGIYFYSIEANSVDGSKSFIEMKKMILMK